MTVRARILLAALAALLVLAVHGTAAAGHQHHHHKTSSAVPTAAGMTESLPQAVASEADCPQHAGHADHDPDSCCGVGCSTAAIDSLDGVPARMSAERLVPALADRVPPSPGGSLFHPPRPAA